MAHLVIYREGAEILRVALDRSETAIGRGGECQLLLADEGVSRRHALIRAGEDGRFTLENLSRNGTLLDGKPVDSAPLADGARIGIGPFKAVFVSGDAGGAAAVDPTRTVSRDPTRVLQVAEDGRKLVVERAVIEALEGPDKGTRWEIRHERAVVGKAPGCDVELKDAYVSSQHFRIENAPSGFRLKDLGSTNGTLVNGVRVADGGISFGSEIKLGKTVLKFTSKREERALGASASSAFEGMVGQGQRMRELFGLLEAVAAADAPVLITGESGSGKELAARAIHNRSHRATRPFLAINCAALSPTLVESELFGHEKGAFTGADRRRAGAFERANGGTLFLDEIGELPLELQSKLLRVLELGELVRVGGSETVKVDVRLVTATHRDLAAMVREKTFREDLFFRLYVVPVKMPPLRERPEDVPLLVESLLAQMAPGGKPPKLAADAMTKLKDHVWPGNVRELRNTLQRALVFSRGGEIGPQHVVFTPLSSVPDDDELPRAQSAAGRNQIEESERDAILAALRRCNGNRKEAAQQLGIARSTLFEKLRRYGIADELKRYGIRITDQE